jgi:hypothetical protein
MNLTWNHLGLILRFHGEESRSMRSPAFWNVMPWCAVAACLAFSKKQHVLLKEWWTSTTLRRVVLWDITSCSPLKVNQHFGRTWCLHLQALLATCFKLVSCSAYSWTLKMEATCSSETSVDFQRTTHRYIPEHRTLHNHHCENLSSHIMPDYTALHCKT